MVIRNRTAVFLWLFAAAWVGMLALMTHVLLRDGPPHGAHASRVVAAFAVFWLAGIGLVAFALAQACTSVECFDDGDLLVVQRFPLRRIARRFPAAQRPAAQLVETTDSDGDPYFACELHVGPPFRSPVRVAEGSRERCEAVRATFEGSRV